MSLIRKLITFLDEDLASPRTIPNAPKYTDTPPSNFRTLSGAAQKNVPPEQDPFCNILYAGVLRFAASMPNPPTPEEQEFTFWSIVNWTRDGAQTRTGMLAYWNFATLSNLDLLSYFSDVNSMERLFLERGPLWLGGTFGTGALVKLQDGTKVPIATVNSVRQWVRSFELTQESHAITLLGVGTKGSQVIIYRDPNLSDKLLSMPFSELKSRVMATMKDPQSGIMYYRCPRCQGNSPDACIRQQAKRLQMSAATYTAS